MSVVGMKCKEGYEVQALRSAAGYYLGTLDEDQCPNCRISNRYTRTAKEAENLIADRMHAGENVFCNGNGNCFDCVKHEKLKSALSFLDDMSFADADKFQCTTSNLVLLYCQSVLSRPNEQSIRKVATGFVNLLINVTDAKEIKLSIDLKELLDPDLGLDKLGSSIMQILSMIDEPEIREIIDNDPYTVEKDWIVENIESE